MFLPPSNSPWWQGLYYKPGQCQFKMQALSSQQPAISLARHYYSMQIMCLLHSSEYSSDCWSLIWPLSLVSALISYPRFFHCFSSWCGICLDPKTQMESDKCISEGSNWWCRDIPNFFQHCNLVNFIVKSELCCCCTYLTLSLFLPPNKAGFIVWETLRH